MSAKQQVAADQSMAVSPVLVSWVIHDPSIHTDLTSSALLTPEGWWLVDPVPITDQALKHFLGSKPVLGILLTNENHERAAHEMAVKKHWAIHAHEATLGRMDINPDFFFRDDETLKGGLQVVHIPGATVGESCFHDMRNRVLMMGDALINLKETGFSFLPDKYCHDPLRSRKAVKRLLDLEFETMTFAHGPPITTNVKKQLKELLSRA